jgi:tetratricopeptide (TPR) repeat protein
MAARRYIEADAEYSDLLRSRPGEPEILVKRGATRFVLHRYTDARTDLELVLAGQPSAGFLAIAHGQLALLEHIQENYAIAIRHFLSALRIGQVEHGLRSPSVGVTWSRLGEAYLATGSTSKAADALATAADILAGSPGYEFQLCLAHTNMGRVRLAQRRYLEAARSLDQARGFNIREDGCTAMIASALGQLYYARGDYPRAEAAFREAVGIGERIWPDGHAATAAALQGLARTFARRRRAEEAITLIRQGLSIDERVLGPKHPDVRELLLDLTALLRRTHRHREARFIAERISREFSESLRTISASALAGR